MKTLKLISGIGLILVGISLMMVPLVVSKPYALFTLIYAIPLIIVGFFILNNKEEEIEKIKTQGEHKRT